MIPAALGEENKETWKARPPGTGQCASEAFRQCAITPTSKKLKIVC